MRPRILVVEDAAALVEAAAAKIAEEAAAAASARGRCRVALAGGTTPRPIYARLASPEFAKRFPWSSSEFYFGDERCVPPEHRESNYAMARSTLFEPAEVPAERVHRIEAEREDREEAAARYEAGLPDRFDLLLLGLGPDGHTASLFPSSSALEERERRVVVVKGPKEPLWRITITPPVIESARSVLVFASGTPKAEAVERALGADADPKRAPAALARGGLWIVDRPAASRLGAQPEAGKGAAS